MQSTERDLIAKHEKTPTLIENINSEDFFFRIVIISCKINEKWPQYWVKFIPCGINQIRVLFAK